MADIALPRRRGATFSASSALAIEWVRANWETVALGGIVLVAAVLRFWDLGARTLHHDESLHAEFSWYLYQGRSYVHDPLMHGPFQFHVNALNFFLFGASDNTARIPHALFGTALVAMPLLLRKQIGMRAVLIAATLIAFSPTLLFFSRFDREDILTVVWTFATVICLWRYLDEGKESWLYGMAGALALSYATKETTYITVAIMLVFLDLMLAIDLAKVRDGPPHRADGTAVLLALTPYMVAALAIGVVVGAPLPLVGFSLQLGDFNYPAVRYGLAAAAGGLWLLTVLWTYVRPDLNPFGLERSNDPAARVITLAPAAWFIAAFWPLIGKRPFGRAGLPLAGDALLVIATMSLPLLSAAIQLLPFVGGGKVYNAPDEQTLKVTTVIVLIVVSAYLGLMWKPRQWLIAAACFWTPFVLLYTTFFTNQPAPWTSAFWHGGGGFFSGTWGSLDYWLAQQGVARGNQPGYYYALFTPLYEFLPLLLTLGGAFWLAAKGNALQRWLLFWIGATFLGLTLAGEKMPWLEVHIALPLALAGGICLAKAMDGLDFSGRWLRTALLACVAAAATLLAVEGDGRLATDAGYVLLGGLIGWVLFAGRAEGLKEMARAALTVTVVALFALTVRAGVVAAFDHGDIPVEMLVYTQTSPELREVRDRIDALAKESGLGLNLPIVVDGTDGFSWPWAWYLRNYHEVSYVNVAPGYTPPQNAVLLIDQANIGNIDTTGFSETPYIHRWWLPENYRGLTLTRIGHILTTGSERRYVAKFFLYRRPANPNSSVKAMALFPASLSAFDVRQPPQPAVAGPAVQPDGRIVVGSGGSGAGQFQQPAGVFVDGQGNIWVADSRNGRIQKFDSGGNYLATLGRSATAQFNEPWSLTIDQDGFVYVADTWNHRIMKFSPALSFVGTWGVPSLSATPGPFELFGPRSIAVGPDGTLWVTDTGNKRLINYSASGQPLGVYGAAGSGAGQFNEEVGLAFDPSGTLYVADTWNGRIQKFGPGMTPAAQFPVPWTSLGVVDKPYLAVLSDGRIIASDPGNGDLLLYSASGTPAGKWNPEAGGKPLGLASRSDGGFVFTDAGTNKLEIVPGNAIAGLFR